MLDFLRVRYILTVALLTLMIIPLSGQVNTTESFGFSYVGADSQTNAVAISPFKTKTYTAGKYEGHWFLRKYDSDGSLDWGVNDLSLNNSEATDVTVDAFGKIYITGYYYNDAQFPKDTDLVDFAILTSSGGSDAFIACYSPSGELLWLESMGQGLNDLGMSLSASDDALYVGAASEADTGIGIYGEPITTMQSSSYVLKFLLSGTFIDAVQYGSSFDVMDINSDFDIMDVMKKTKIDVSYYDNAVYATGCYRDNITVYQSDTSTPYTSNTATNMTKAVFISKLDQDLNHIWFTNIETDRAISKFYGASIAVDCNGVYVAGGIDGHATPGNSIRCFNPDQITDISSSDSYTFVGKFSDTDGGFQWLNTTGFLNPTSIFVETPAYREICADNDGLIWTIGDSEKIATSGNTDVLYASGLTDTYSYLNNADLNPNGILFHGIDTETGRIEFFDKMGAPEGQIGLGIDCANINGQKYFAHGGGVDLNSGTSNAAQYLFEYDNVPASITDASCCAIMPTLTISSAPLSVSYCYGDVYAFTASSDMCIWLVTENGVQRTIGAGSNISYTPTTEDFSIVGVINTICGSVTSNTMSFSLNGNSVSIGCNDQTLNVPALSCVVPKSDIVPGFTLETICQSVTTISNDAPNFLSVGAHTVTHTISSELVPGENTLTSTSRGIASSFFSKSINSYTGNVSLGDSNTLTGASPIKSSSINVAGTTTCDGEPCQSSFDSQSMKFTVDTGLGVTDRVISSNANQNTSVELNSLVIQNGSSLTISGNVTLQVVNGIELQAGTSILINGNVEISCENLNLLSASQIRVQSGSLIILTEGNVIIKSGSRIDRTSPSFEIITLCEKSIEIEGSSDIHGLYFALENISLGDGSTVNGALSASSIIIGDNNNITHSTEGFKLFNSVFGTIVGTDPYIHHYSNSSIDSVIYYENGTHDIIDYLGSDDIDSEGSGFLWELSGVDASLFSIDPDFGIFSFNSRPDFESPEDNNGDNIYEITVKLTDSDGDSFGLLVVLTVEDVIAQTNSCSSTITVADAINPTVTCADATINLDASGDTLLVPTALVSASADNCAIASTTSVPTSLDCSNLGSNAVDVTVTDDSGNSTTCTSNVTIVDNLAPVSICNDITLPLDATGNASITAVDIGGASSDNCAITSQAIDIVAFTESHVGVNSVGLTNLDQGFLFSSCTSIVNVVDNTAPIALCQDVSIDVGPTGSVTISPAILNNGSTDNTTLVFTASQTTFTCGDIGPSNIILTVTDAGLNNDQCSSVVTVTNTNIPTALCRDITLALDGSGDAILTPSTIDNGSSVACPPMLFTVDQNVFDCSDLGDILVTLTVNDNNGNSASCTSTVTVEDSVDPVPDLITLTTLTDQCSVAMPTAPTSTDNCGGSFIGTTSTLFPVTVTTTITWTYTDGDLNSSSQTQEVVIVDTTPPVADIATLPTLTDQCSVAAPTPPTATDNCGGSFNGTTSTIFPVAVTTTITWTYTDADGNASTQTQEVIIDDVTPPTADVVTLTTLTGECSISSLTAPTATDNCDGLITATTTTLTPITASTTITWTFTDVDGNQSTQTQLVDIDDITAPETPNLDPIIEECTATLIAPTTTDNCTGSITGTTTDDLTYTTQGTHVIAWNFDDGNGNVITVNQNVIITGTTDPITPTLVDVIGQCSATAVVPTTTTGNCTQALITIQAVTDLSNLYDELMAYPGGVPHAAIFGNGETLSPGVYDMAAEFSMAGTLNLDGGGDPNSVFIMRGTGAFSTTASTTLVLTGNAKPENIFWVCSGAIAIGASTIMKGTMIGGGAGAGAITLGANTDFEGILFSKLGAISLGADVILTIPTGTAPFNLGILSTFAMWSSSGAVSDVASATTTGDVGTALGTLAMIGIHIGDEYPEDSTATTSFSSIVTGTTTDALTYTAQGTHVITWSFDDGNGNVITVNQNVIINDTTDPLTPVLADVIGQCSSTATASTTTDNCAGTITGTTSDALTYTTQGTHIIAWLFDDGNGNVITVNQNVIITDTTDPIATCPSDITGGFDVSCQFTLLDYRAGASATDNCSLSPAITFTQSPVSGTVVTGITVITITAEDEAGNTGICTFNINASDSTDPATPVLADVTGQCAATATAPTTTDNCAGTVTGTTSDALTYTTQGTHVIAWLFDDGNGNSITVNQNVIITDTTDPVTPALADVIGQCSATAVASTTTDNCAGTITGTTTDALTYSMQGTHLIAWDFNDGNGNTITVNQNVVITDTTDPATPLLADVTGQCTATATASTTTDNCSGTITGTTTDALTYSTQGTHLIAWDFNDGNGNSITVNQNVIITDTTDPVTPVLADVIGQCTATATASTTTDNCAGTITGTTSDALTYSTQGTHLIAWDFNDGNGNTITVNQNVVITDATDPVTPVLADVTGQCTATATASTTTDNCAGTITGTTTDDLTYTTLGTHVIAWNFDDGNGNVITVNQNVIITDTTDPITPTLVDVIGQCSATAVVPTTTTDNCTQALITIQAVTDLSNLYDELMAYPGGVPHAVIFGNGETLSPGVYDMAAAFSIAGTLTLDGGGDPNSMFIMRGTGAFSTTASTTLVLTGNAKPENIFWVSSAAMSIGASTIMKGTMIGGGAGAGAITLGANTEFEGMLFSKLGAISLGADVILTIPTGTAPFNLGILSTFAMWSSSGAVSDVASSTTTGDVGTASGALAMNGTHIGDEYPEDSTATTSYASNVTGTTTDALTYTAQGTHVITWSFDDGNGNVITVNQNVIITDTTNPEATCPPDVTVSFDTNCQYSLLDYTSVSSATDNCSTSPAITFTQNPGLGTVVTGSTVITIIAEDELGNTGTCTFNNIVIDDINPEISCSTDTLLAPLDENGTITLIPGMFVNSADQYPRSDNCQIESFGIDNLTGAGNLTFSCSNINEDQSIELIVTDESGNFSSCEAIVMIVDTISPLPICNDFVLWTSSEGPTVLHALSYLDTLYNNCPDNALTFYLTQDAFTPEDMGDPILQTVTVIDQSGNVGSCVSEVTIINGESIMTCPLDTTLYLDEFGSNLVMFNDLMTVTDIFLEVQIDPEDYLFALGVDSIIYDCSNIGLNELTISITNSSNHPASCTFNINLVDNIAPVIICQETEVQVTLDGDCRFEIADYLTEFDGSPNFNLTDNCTSYGGTVTQSLPAGTYEYSAFTNGNELPVILSATDSTGNVGTCAINYVLTGAVSPLVECTNDTIRIAVDADSCEVILNDNTLEAPVLQSCVALYPVTYETTTGAVSLDVGFHSVRWEVKDVFEQEASCIQVIEIYDNTIPEITCPLISVQCLTPDLDALVDPEVTDNCINGLSLTKNMSNILSTYSINWIVTDISGNADSSCIQIIEKVDSVDIPYAGEDQVLNSAFSGILIGNTPEIGNPHWITDGDATIYDPTSNITNISNLSIGENKFEYELREEGCESRTDSVIVTVTEFFIPTGFSPNGDGVNDELIIQGILANPQSELMIFDRMGKKVLSEKGYQNDWDGTAKSGALLPRDTYFYILEIPGATSFKGSIEIKY